MPTGLAFPSLSVCSYSLRALSCRASHRTCAVPPIAVRDWGDYKRGLLRPCRAAAGAQKAASGASCPRRPTPPPPGGCGANAPQNWRGCAARAPSGGPAARGCPRPAPPSPTPAGRPQRACMGGAGAGSRPALPRVCMAARRPAVPAAWPCCAAAAPCSAAAAPGGSMGVGRGGETPRRLTPRRLTPRPAAAACAAHPVFRIAGGGGRSNDINTPPIPSRPVDVP